MTLGDVRRKDACDDVIGTAQRLFVPTIGLQRQDCVGYVLMSANKENEVKE